MQSTGMITTKLDNEFEVWVQDLIFDKKLLVLDIDNLIVRFNNYSPRAKGFLVDEYLRKPAEVCRNIELTFIEFLYLKFLEELYPSSLTDKSLIILGL